RAAPRVLRPARPADRHATSRSPARSSVLLGLRDGSPREGLWSRAGFGSRHPAGHRSRASSSGSIPTPTTVATFEERMTMGGPMAKQIPLVDYLELGDDPHLRANQCIACGARFFDR